MGQIRAEGVNIRSEVIDEKDNVIKHTLIINNLQFIPCLQRHAHKGLTYIEIVKRREPGFLGHTHWPRIGVYTAEQTEYQPHFNDIAKRLSALGHDDNTVAYVLNITDLMLDFWKKQYPLFSEAIRQGKRNYNEQGEISMMRPNDKANLNRYGHKPNEMR